MPSAHPLLSILRVQQEILVDILPDKPSNAELDETIRTTSAQTYGLCALLRHGHPVRAMSLSELGKLLAMDEPAPSDASDSSTAPTPIPSSPAMIPNAGLPYPPPYLRSDYPPSGAQRLALAVQTLRQAHAELRIAFGSRNGKEGGEVGVDVRGTLVRLEQELAVWKSRSRLALTDAMAGMKT